jgi:hypothetical protein
MADDSRVPPLTKRAPGESGMRRRGAQYTGVVLPESVVERVRAALENSREQDPDFKKVAPLQAAPGLPESPELPESRDLLEAPRVPESLGLPEPRDLLKAPKVPEAPKVTEPAAFQEAPEPSAPATKETTPPSPWFPVNPDDDTAWFATISMPQPASETASRRSAAAVPGTHASAAGSSQTATPAAIAGSAQAAPRVYAGRRYRMAGALIAVVVLVATGLVAFALSRHSGDGSHRPPVPAPHAIRDIREIRESAASWVASQISASAILSCDPAMCQALRARGIPAARLLVLRSVRTDPLRSRIVVATETVRSEFGRRLTSVYAPAVIASFGSGSLRIDIRAIAPHGAAAYLSQMKADLQTRKDAGAGVAGSQLITTSAAARAQLTEGKVDWRLLFTIAELAGIQRVSILAFGDSGPGASPGMPLRSADLAEAVSGVDTPSPAYVRSLVNFLRLQRGIYAPAHIWTVRVAGGRTALRIEFAAPIPPDMLNPLSSGMP